jgi:hypothetical protein
MWDEVMRDGREWGHLAPWQGGPCPPAKKGGLGTAECSFFSVGTGLALSAGGAREASLDDSHPEIYVYQ